MEVTATANGIVTAEEFYFDFEGVPVAGRAAAAERAKGKPIPQPRNEVAPRAEAKAYVNHGRWIVECPFCPSAQIAARSDRRFFCAECFNEPIGRRWVRVVWPASEAYRERIEALLLARPAPATRNWLPEEPLQQLLSENRAHGVA